MSVSYEWDVETVKEDDVQEHAHSETLREALDFLASEKPPAGCRFEIVLVRDDSDRRAWAYLEDDGSLPSCFYDADGHPYRRVPKRFHDEVKKAQTP